MTTINCSLSHPIIFVFDFDNNFMDVPEYDQNHCVSFNETCASVKAISDVDGELNVTLMHAGDDGDYYSGLKKAFDGVIQSPNRKISVVTSLNEKLIELDVENETSEIKIYVDEYEFPSRIVIAVSRDNSG